MRHAKLFHVKRGKKKKRMTYHIKGGGPGQKGVVVSGPCNQCGIC
jgi:hypothetical protein